MLLRKALRIGIHVLAWLTIAYIFNQVFRVQLRTFHIRNGIQTESVTMHTFPGLIVVALVFKILFFYVNALPYVCELLSARKWRTYLVIMLLSAISAAGIEWVIMRVYISNRPDWDKFAWSDLLGYGLAFGAGLAYFLRLAWERAEKRAQAIATEQARTELDFLKAQINPHFFLNTLNNLYSMAQARDLEQLEDGILQLSEMMRYILYECRADRVPVTKELAYIKSYIGTTLSRYRQDGHINVKLTADEGKLQNCLIAPVILIPFVENAFKHGVSLEESSSIDIRFERTPEKLHFSIKNTDHSRKVVQLGQQGIGIANVRRRLEMLYTGRYTLDICQENGYHIIQLQLSGL